MIRVVVDTNVVVSAVLSENGFPASILDLGANKRIMMCVSTEVLEEYEEVLRRPRLKLSLARIEKAMELIRSTSRIVRPRRKLELAADPDDNLFYECADAAGANFLITGNIKHFPSGHESTEIVTPRQFMERLGPVLFKASRWYLVGFEEVPDV